MSAAAPKVTTPVTFAPRPELLQAREFHKERSDEYFKPRSRRPFAPIPHAELKAIILNPEEFDHERVMAYLHLMANGNFSDYGVDLSGNPIGQSDIAEALGLPKQYVSRAVQYLETKYRLRREGRKLYPIDDPAAYREACQAGESHNSCDFERRRGEDFQRFRPIFEAEHPDYIQRRAESQARIEQEKTVLKEIAEFELAEFKRWQRSQTPVTKEGQGHILPRPEVTNSREEPSQTPVSNGAHYIKEELTNSSEECGPEEESVFEGKSLSSASPQTTTTTNPPSVKQEPPTESEATEEQIITGIIGIYCTRPEASRVGELIEEIRQVEPSATTQDIKKAIELKAPLCKDRGKFVSFLFRALPKVFVKGGLARLRAAPPPDPTLPALSLEEEQKN